jgi:membrane protein YdbS with pleckstrin-like domain
MDIDTLTTAVTENPATLLGIDIKIFLLITIAVMIIKGFALWKAAEKRSKGWFWVLIFVNTLGILDALYLWVFSKRK